MDDPSDLARFNALIAEHVAYAAKVLAREGVVRSRVSFKMAYALYGRPRGLRAGTYKFDRPLTPLQVIDKLKENNADIKTGSVLDYNKVKKTEAGLKFMAIDKGYPDAKIRSKVESMGRSQVALTFEVTEGPKGPQATNVQKL